MRVKKQIVLFWLFLSSFQVLSAGEECSFDPAFFSEKTYRAFKQVRDVYWLPETQEARIILNSGDVLMIKHWSCNHFGLDAVLISSQEAEDILEKINQLASIVLDKHDRASLQQVLKEKPPSQIKRLDVPSEYSEFFVSIIKFDNYQTIRIKYYRD